jgi:hypothetical protein
VTIVVIEVIEPVIVLARLAVSRAGRGGPVRPATVTTIQGGKTFSLVGPHSRLKESHGGKERKRPEGRG